MQGPIDTKSMSAERVGDILKKKAKKKKKGKAALQSFQMGNSISGSNSL